VQNNAIRFSAKLKGRDSITWQIRPWNSYNRRFKLRHNLLSRLISNEESHASLTNSYGELITTDTKNPTSTWS